MFNHETVLLKEAVDILNINPDGVYVDATLGGAGHSELILKQLSNSGKLIAFDQDLIAINSAVKKLGNEKKFIPIHSNFKNLKTELNKLGIFQIDGILFDLGVSSMQIDCEDRGFSYIHEGPLDMRMDQTSDFSAYNVINEYDFHELQHIFKKFGEEKFAKQIARGIENKCRDGKIKTTKELSDVILSSIPKKAFYAAKSHPSKRVFQAVRIEVNKELDVFESTLKDAFSLLKVDGIIAVITFHSLEDKICKYYFKEWTEVDSKFNKLPILPKSLQPPAKLINKKPILPLEEEEQKNSRCKSAKLRALRKVTDEVL